MKDRPTFNSKVPSLNELKETVSAWFVKKYSVEPVLISSGRNKPLKLPSEEVHLVVLADSICSYLGTLQTAELPQHFLWVLCNSIKQVLVKVFGLSELHIGVLPRYELFPKIMPAYSLEDSEYFLYSGRLIDEKNTDLVILLFRQLVKDKIFQNHRLIISSPQRPLEVSDQVKNLLRRNSDVEVLWNSDNQWIQRVPSRPAGILLSTYRLEDFGVSAARLQQTGSPLILSHWFGHKDIEGDNVHFLDLEALNQLSLKNSKISLIRKSKNTVRPFHGPKLSNQDYLYKLKHSLSITLNDQFLLKMFLSDETADIDQPAFNKFYDILS
jgi:hypothetical protein